MAINPTLSKRNSEEQTIAFIENQPNSSYLPAESTLEPIMDSYLAADDYEESNTIVEYSFQTGIEREYTVDFNEIRSPVNQLESFEGNYYRKLNDQNDEQSYTSGLGSSSGLGMEELDRVYDTTQYPFSAVVKMYVRTIDGLGYVGSGAMISPIHVLTAGHVVYGISEGGWMEEIIAMPGKNGTGSSLTEEPYGRAYATHARSTRGWTHEPTSANDWAVVTLDRPIGNETGWLGVKTLPLGHENYTGMLYTAGYPAEYFNGWYMYNNSGTGLNVDEYNHYYNFYGEGGQSGSGVWTYQNSSPYILSIYAYSNNMGTRITQEKFDLINLWLAEDAATEPFVDFDVAGSNNLLSALDNQPFAFKLLTKIPIFTWVQNHGNIEATTSVAFYLSEDEDITTDDYKIGQMSVTLDPGELRLINYVARIPLSVPPGPYEIGWIIDPDNETAESFEDNNDFLNGLNIRVYSTFVDEILTSPLYMSLIISGVVVAIALPTTIGILKRRKKLRAQ
jgi:V8-like Glu-specific endopeptidase